MKASFYSREGGAGMGGVEDAPGCDGSAVWHSQIRTTQGF